MKKGEGPKQVREALQKYLEKAGISEKIEAASVVPEWPNLVGEGIAGVTTPLRVTNGVLVVGVRSSAWLSELKLMEREIIKRVSGQSLHEFSRDNIFQPLGMNETGFLPGDELKARAADHEPLNSGAIQAEDSGLHAAAVRHFGSYDKALRAAKVDPQDVRRRRTWTKPQVVAAMKSASRSGRNLADSSVRRENPALYGAAVRLFGTFTAARKAAGVKYKRRTS